MNQTIKPFKHLEKWQKTLASCIRCGYCYEHCPLFKHTRWETDSPRAKIITAFGLLSGELEPSASAAEKLFSCFYCKRCEAACSSGVLLTDIFTDARKDLLEMGFSGPGTTSTTRMTCARCLICVRSCPHEARSFDGKQIVTDPVKCQSCGICLEVCPAGAAVIENTFGTGRNELIDRAAGFLERHDTAKAIVFACNWSYFPDLQSSELPESEIQDKPYEILVNMCGGRLEPHLLMAPFLHNAWGVLVACCMDDDCRHGGNLRAKKIVEHLHHIFKSMGINPERIRLVQIPTGDKSLFQARIDTFIDHLTQLGPIR